MSKRFTDTDKWKKPFIRGLQGAYKLLWLYILDDCDHAGIWQVDFEVAQIRIGERVDEKRAISLLGDRIEIFNNGSKWFLRDFIDFQYGQLSDKNRMHVSVINILTKNEVGPYKPLIRGQIQGQGTIQGNGQEQGKGQGTIQPEPEILIWPTFDDFWEFYDKKEDRPKCEKKWKKINQEVREKIMLHVEAYVRATPDKQYRKNPVTYLNNESWNNEIIINGKQNGIPDNIQALINHQRAKKSNAG